MAAWGGGIRAPACQDRETFSSSGSTTCSASRTSRRRSPPRMVLPRRISRRNMQRPCAICSNGSAHVASASSSQAVTPASAVGTARTALEKSSLSPSSLHPVRVAFYLARRRTSHSNSPHLRGFAGPWVTAVGGTTKSEPEIAASISGGGFSSVLVLIRSQIDEITRKAVTDTAMVDERLSTSLIGWSV
jgi:hypothetical protein